MTVSKVTVSKVTVSNVTLVHSIDMGMVVSKNSQLVPPTFILILGSNYGEEAKYFVFRIPLCLQKKRAKILC